VVDRGRLRAVDAVQVQTCWEIGRQIVEFEQAARHGRNMDPAATVVFPLSVNRGV
jgi:hypothetical protein